MSKKVVIIGAGVGGMAAANILAKAGFSVSVYEQNSGPGGRMDTLQKDGFVFDTGPSWYLMKDVFEHYFGLFDKKTQDYYQLTRLDPAYKVFFDYRKPLVITKSIEKNKSLFESIEVGAGSTLDTYLETAERSYKLAMQYFLYNPFTKIRSVARADVLKVLPLFGGLFLSRLHAHITRRFKSLALQQVLEYPSVFLGASPFDIPALYQLMSFLDFKEGVYYPKKGGMYEVTKALYSLGKELGVAYHFQTAVKKIIVKDGNAKGIIVGNKVIEADMVISNADLHFTETKLLSSQHQTYPEKYWNKRKAGPSGLLLYLGVSGSVPELKHHNLFFTKKWQENFADIYTHKTWPEAASMYVSKTSATDPTVAPKGSEAIFVLVPLPAAKSLPQKQLDAYVDHCIGVIAEQAGISDLQKRILFKEVRSPDTFKDQFNSWHYTALGMSHTLRQSAFLRPRLKSKKVKNLYYVGAGTQPGVGVPMCIISAQLLYKTILKDHSAGPPAKISEISL